MTDDTAPGLAVEMTPEELTEMFRLLAQVLVHSEPERVRQFLAAVDVTEGTVQ